MSSENVELGDVVATVSSDQWRRARKAAVRARRRTTQRRVLCVLPSIAACAWAAWDTQAFSGLAVLASLILAVTALVSKRIIASPRGPSVRHVTAVLEFKEVELVKGDLIRLLVKGGVISGPLWFRARTQSEGVTVYVSNLDGPEFRRSTHFFMRGF